MDDTVKGLPRPVEIASRKKMAEDLSLKIKILDLISDAVILHDIEGYIIYVNKAFMEEFNLSAKDIQTRRVPDLFDYMINDMYQERLNLLIKNKAIRFEQKYIKDMEEFYMEVNSRAVMINDKEVVLSICRNITERIEHENALAMAVRKYRSLLEHTSDWIWEIDDSCVIIYSNKRVEGFLGYAVIEVLGEQMCKLSYPEDEKQIWNTYTVWVNDLKKRYLSDMFCSITVEHEVLHKEGQTVHFNSRITAYKCPLRKKIYFRGASTHVNNLSPQVYLSDYD